MKSQFKTKEQVEFSDMARELMGERFGFSQNRIAAICHLKPPMVSMVLQGKRNPGPAALELLRREYHEFTRPKGPGEVVMAPDELKEQIDFLKRHAPPSYEAAKAAVGALHKEAVAREVILYKKGKKRPANSDEVSQAAVDADKAASKVESDAQSGSGQYGGAVSQPVHRVQPAPASSRAAKVPHTVREGKGRR